MVKKVEFRPEDYGPGVAGVLALAGGGKRPMPLVKTACVSDGACEAVKGLESPADSVRSGLYLYFGCWDAAHSAADSIENPDGYFWHAIVHRQEPDPGNAAYWFRKTGRHPVFPRLAAEINAADIGGYRAGLEWDPFAFIEFSESARRRPGSTEEQAAMQIQLVEWQLLFDYCARGQNC
jgi:hypothetical protein